MRRAPDGGRRVNPLTRLSDLIDSGSISLQFALVVLVGIILASGSTGLAIGQYFGRKRGFHEAMSHFRTSSTPRL